MIHKIPRWVLIGGAILAFSAAMVNAIALLGFAHQGVTHVTGNFSRLSIAILQGDYPRIHNIFFIFISFFLGSMISGIILRDGHLKLRAEYGWALALESLLLVLSAYALHRGSDFGDYFASMAAGLQNALASTYSGAIIRTTHLTGVVTDLGVLVGHMIHGIKIDTRRIKLFLTLIVAFILGGILGGFCYNLWNNWAMLVPAAIVGISSIGYSFFAKQSGDQTAKGHSGHAAP